MPNVSLKSIESLSSRIKIISKERIIVELNKILLTDKPSIGFTLLEKCYQIFQIQLSSLAYMNSLVLHRTNMTVGLHTLQCYGRFEENSLKYKFYRTHYV